MSDSPEKKVKNAFSSPTMAGLMHRRGGNTPSKFNRAVPQRPPPLQEDRPKSPEVLQVIGQIQGSTAVSTRVPKRTAAFLPKGSPVRSIGSDFSISQDDDSQATPENVRAALSMADSVLDSLPAVNIGFGSGSEEVVVRSKQTAIPAPKLRDSSKFSSARSVSSTASSPAARRLEALTREGIESRKKAAAAARKDYGDDDKSVKSMPAGSPLRRPIVLDEKSKAIHPLPSPTRPPPSPDRQRSPTPEGIAVRSIKVDHDNRSVDSRISTISTSSRRSLDLIHNDNAFHVVANLVVERCSQKANDGDTELYLDADDLQHLDKMVPPSVRESFVKAVRWRLQHNCPEKSEAVVHVLTRQCREFGLDREGEANPLLASVYYMRPGQTSITIKGLPPITSGKRASGESRSIARSSSGSANVPPIQRSFAASSGSFAGSTPPIQHGSVLASASHELSHMSVSPSPTMPTTNSTRPEPTTFLKPPLAKTTGLPEAENRSFRAHLDEQNRRLRAREVELLENASVASVLTVPSVTSEAHLSTTESLARKQLMAELREASTLMAESQTPEAAEFWKNHVVSLQSRLRSLHNETASQASVDMDEDENNRPSTTRGRDPYLPINSTPSADTHFFSAPAGYGPPRYSRDMYTPPKPSPESPPRTRKSPSSLSKASSPPPRPSPLSVAKSAAAASVASRASPNSPTRSSMHRSPHRSFADPTPSVASDRELGPPLVDVVSPADLPGGYMFEAEIDGKRFLATVPPGGIGKGETFSCVMQTMAKPGPSVPFGSWRDGLCNCFRHGICHPFLLNTIVCPLLALGQVMTRMQLDAFGHPLKTRGNAHASMFVITLFWAGMNGFIYVCYNYKWFHNMPLTIPDYIAVALLNFTLCLYTFYVVSTTRAAVRAKYEIQEQRFFDLEDNCCATFCLPCTICQLGRHTAPYDMLDARCCSKTGLKETVSLDYLDKATIP